VIQSDHQHHARGGVTISSPQFLAGLCERHAPEIDFNSVPDLVDRFGVRFPAEPVLPALEKLSDRDVTIRRV
jgi:hypothetical protein